MGYRRCWSMEGTFDGIYGGEPGRKDVLGRYCVVLRKYRTLKREYIDREERRGGKGREEKRGEEEAVVRRLCLFVGKGKDTDRWGRFSFVRWCA